MSEYLWDRSGVPAPEVVDLESRLAPLAFDPAARPLDLSAVTVTPPRTGRRLLATMLVTAAAIALLVTGAVLWHDWRLDWAPSEAWVVHGGGRLAEGAPLPVPATGARLDIARLGVLSARPGTALMLESTGPRKHWLRMTRGSIDVRLWAPPGRVALHTPAGDVIDLGCIFSLDVEADGETRLQVHTGWVNLENAHGNTFVPAGASATMRADRAPLVPVYDDAPAKFRAAVRAIEAAPLAPAPDALARVTAEARPRDALTVLMLSDIEGLPRDPRTTLLRRLAEVQPPPSPQTVARVVAGDRDAFWTWFDSLPLPSLKNWWANWQDVFPR